NRRSGPIQIRKTAAPIAMLHNGRMGLAEIRRGQHATHKGARHNTQIGPLAAGESGSRGSRNKNPKNTANGAMYLADRFS
ncbi:MAG: hypothetical protein ACRD4G_17495, partial [Bryobacteraceae bacterium]